jgi:hypothetical protein
VTEKALIQDFVAQKTLAVVGVSRGGKKFGNMALRALRDKGYRVFPIHPQAESLEGASSCSPSRSVPSTASTGGSRASSAGFRAES